MDPDPPARSVAAIRFTVDASLSPARTSSSVGAAVGDFAVFRPSDATDDDDDDDAAREADRSSGRSATTTSSRFAATPRTIRTGCFLPTSWNGLEGLGRRGVGFDGASPRWFWFWFWFLVFPPPPPPPPPPPLMPLVDPPLFTRDTLATTVSSTTTSSIARLAASEVVPGVATSLSHACLRSSAALGLLSGAFSKHRDKKSRNASLRVVPYEAMSGWSS